VPTDESRLPLTPVLPWQRPPVTRNRKGQWQRGVSGNPKGRPTKAKLAARLTARPATRDGYERMRSAAAYEGMMPEELTRLLRSTYGKLGWQAQAARDMRMSKRSIRRWAKGAYKISYEKEKLLLALCLRLSHANYRYVLAHYRRAVAAANAREALASIPRYRPLTRPGPPRMDF
jgi:Family of unknown function (DUF5681)